MKKYIFLFISIFTLTTLSPTSVLAQRRGGDDRFEQNAAKKADNTKATEGSKSKAIKQASPNATSTKVSAAAASTVVSASSSPKAAYAQILTRLETIQTQLDVLSTQLMGSRGGKAKKIVKQIDALQREKTSLNAQKPLFSRSITDPEYAQAQDQREREEYMAELAAKTSELIAKTDPFAGKMSDDPELQKTYREYVDTFMPRQAPETTFATGDKVYRVMFAIAKKAINVQEIQAYGQVMEQRLPSGGIAYYVGLFTSREAAQGVCNKILATGKYRDAFVVAMVGNKRVPL